MTFIGLPFSAHTYFYITQVRDINDMIYGTVSLYYPLNLIVDTPEFQRLRRLRQVGAAIFVYPNADHSRFAHCLG